MNDHDFKNVKYPTLAGMVEQGPAVVRRIIAEGGHDNIPIQEKKFDLKGAKEVKQIQAQRGMIFMHEKRGTKVTILKPNIAEGIHLVAESRTGKTFRALDKYLKLI